MESGGLLQQLGINWQLLVSQAVNFFILLSVLTFFVYKPLLAVIKKRNDKIREGLEKAAAADVRLKEVDIIAKEHLKKADRQAIEIIRTAEERGEAVHQSLQKRAQQHHAQVMAQMEVIRQRQQEEVRNLVFGQALELVKKALLKTVQMNPKHVDEALIKKAVAHVENETA